MPEGQVQAAQETPEDRVQRKLAEVRAALRQAEAIHEEFMAARSGPGAFERYREYRQTELTDFEREDLENARRAEAEYEHDETIPADRRWAKGYIDGDYRLALSPLRRAQMQIALDRANDQIGATIYPEEPGLMEKYPGVDPRGKYTEADMAIAQRLARVEAALSVRPPEIQEYVRNVLGDMRKESTEMGGKMATLVREGDVQRLYSRAAKVALDETTSDHLEEEVFGKVKSSQALPWADRTIRALESLTGLSDSPITQEQRDEMAQDGQPIPQEVEALRDAPNTQPASLAVDFPDFNHEMEYRFLSDPRHWGQKVSQMRVDPANTEQISQAIGRYATATGNRTLDGCYNQIEALTGSVAGISRGDLVTVDGMTVREHMERQYLQEHKSMAGFDKYYGSNVRQRAGEIVSAGLMAGKRVEAFIPDKMGRIPKEPAQITKTGFTPTPLQPVVLNAWERFFSKRGFYKEKTARAEEYRRIMEARERVHLKNDFQRSEIMGVNSDYAKNLFFGGPEALKEQLGNVNSPYSVTRSAVTTMCVAGLAAQGHSFEDIMDPDKLQAERQAMSRTVVEKVRNNDHEWIGKTMYDGQKVLIEEADRRIAGVNLTDPKQIQEKLSSIAPMSAALFDLWQEIRGNDPFVGVQARIAQEAPGLSAQAMVDRDMAMQERLMIVGNVGISMSESIRSRVEFSDPNMAARFAADDPTVSVECNHLCNFISGVTVLSQMEQIRQQKPPKGEQPRPFSTRMSGFEVNFGLMSGHVQDAGATRLMDGVQEHPNANERGRMVQAMSRLALSGNLARAISTQVNKCDPLSAPVDIRMPDGKGGMTDGKREISFNTYAFDTDVKGFLGTLTKGAQVIEKEERVLAEAQAAKSGREAQKQAQKEQPAAKKPSQPKTPAAGGMGGHSHR